MAYSKPMQDVLDKHSFKNDEVLYLPIAQTHLKRIKDGSKKVEFRDLSDFYLKKVANFDKDGRFLSEKPLKAVLFQGGYSATSPRVLIQFKGAFERSPKESPICKNQLILKESIIEGFTNEDEFLAIVLGDILHTENF